MGLFAAVCRLRFLNARDSTVASLPYNVRTLLELHVSCCPNLRHVEFLGGDLATLRVLDLSGTGVERLPEGLSALEELSVKYCKNLAGIWLPESSARELRLLDVRFPHSITSVLVFMLGSIA